jgi:hypothetical protein
VVLLEVLSEDLEKIANSDAACARLQQIPGVGPLVSTAVVSAIGNGAAFHKGREFAAGNSGDVKIPAGSFPAVALGRSPPQQSSAQSGAWWSSHIHRRSHKGGIPDSPDHEYRCGAMTTYAGRAIEGFA